jgi:hypothetical protein
MLLFMCMLHVNSMNMNIDLDPEGTRTQSMDIHVPKTSRIFLIEIVLYNFLVMGTSTFRVAKTVALNFLFE